MLSQFGGTIPSTLSGYMECLALTLLGLAQKCEIEPGQEVLSLPPMTEMLIASLAGIVPQVAAPLFQHLRESGIILAQRERMIISAPHVLYRLALGVVPL